MFAIEALKSMILALSCVDRRLTVDQAVLLSRLEEEYQVRLILIRGITLIMCIVF